MRDARIFHHTTDVELDGSDLVEFASGVLKNFCHRLPTIAPGLSLSHAVTLRANNRTNETRFKEEADAGKCPNYQAREIEEISLSVGHTVVVEDSLLRAMTWNIHGSARPDVSILSSTISRESPDIVGLQEVRASQARSIAESLGMHHVWSMKHNPYAPFTRWAEGLAVLSMNPILEHGVHELNAPTSRRSHRRRIALCATSMFGERRISIVNTHLSSHTAERARATEAVRIRAIVDNLHDSFVIVTADLNDDGEPMIVQTISGDDLHDTWDTDEQHDSGNTCPAHRPTMRLDHVLVPRGASVESVVVATPTVTTISDHLPVVAVMRL